LADTVVARVYDHVGIRAEVSKRWQSEQQTKVSGE
jgi:3-polyprenyl-4-hydroxybenzoate decarboxylase